MSSETIIFWHSNSMVSSSVSCETAGLRMCTLPELLLCSWFNWLARLGECIATRPPYLSVKWRCTIYVVWWGPGSLPFTIRSVQEILVRAADDVTRNVGSPLTQQMLIPKLLHLHSQLKRHWTAFTTFLFDPLHFLVFSHDLYAKRAKLDELAKPTVNGDTLSAISCFPPKLVATMLRVVGARPIAQGMADLDGNGLQKPVRRPQNLYWPIFS